MIQSCTFSFTLCIKKENINIKRNAKKVFQSTQELNKRHLKVSQKIERDNKKQHSLDKILTYHG